MAGDPLQEMSVCEQHNILLGGGSSVSPSTRTTLRRAGWGVLPNLRLRTASVCMNLLFSRSLPKGDSLGIQNGY